MKTYSIIETQYNLSRVLKEVEAGNVVGITRSKKLVARLFPPLDPEEAQFPDFAARASEVWGKRWTGTSSDARLDETRGDR